MNFCIRPAKLISSLPRLGKKSERITPKNRTKNGVVLDGRRDGVVPGAQHAEDDEVQGVGRIIAETEPVGVRAVEELRQLLARLLDDQAGLHAEVVSGTPGVDAEVPIEVVHVAVDLFGLGE